ncbi:major capsid protein [Microbacterium phage Avocadoman]|uniref:major capsid protein n=1 Tax=Microbacterium phage Albright TaxID=2816467 RepID=UPI0018A519C5|nr:major capsid protein [Microbacterium phage Albright]YP_010753089.1 major capsid protein [Microbacterium phage Doobus]YP_010753227.1 major capsid protein [Microbacterium phage DickRichards]YP_010753295.1 major capsid protein [Microbacterium phage Avocadoman]QOP64835.1 major capsid protein [Microbacterium phage Avocadoman]QOP66324.1 major capsid protein [Microbacterium phage DickRichards]QTF82181.1 major capsid protein [Microbacterium phage Albright]QZE10226.1 major capsid protein [Microbac
MDPKAELAQLEAKNSAIIAGVKASKRDLTDAEVADLEKDADRITELKAIIARGEKNAELMARFSTVEDSEDTPAAETPKAATLGEHFVKSGAQANFLKGQGQRTASAPEFKAATDTNLVAGNGQVQYGGVYETPLRRLTIASLLGSGTMNNTSLTYWVQGAVEGNPTAVAEDGQKPQIHFNFSPVTEALSKIAVITKVSDEAMADTDYLVSVINSQLVGRLMVVEEDQILNGSGTAPNLRGILNRTGLQTYATTATYTPNKGFDAIFHAITMVATGSAQETADGIVINPADYETLRLSKDGNDNYRGGGPFAGGNPGLWGVRTVVTPAIAAGTVLVGAFGTAAQLFRKGGIQVDSTNSDSTDFQFNRVALRAEERILLAVYRPAAFVKLTLTA